ncbi:MAG TPA: hypothetical protein VML75_16260 [Kofleriaceae bacterium]|nr:hypothetical protein [Kofleriaceae bacterium]
MKTALMAAAIAALAACRPAPIESCRDPLAGVWQDTAEPAQRYHLVASAGGYEMYPLFDTAAPTDGTPKADSPIVYAPIVFDFQPDGDGYRGSRTQRITHGPLSCAPRTPARIERCGGESIVIALELPGMLDWSTCERAPSPGTETITLARVTSSLAAR